MTLPDDLARWKHAQAARHERGTSTRSHVLGQGKPVEPRQTIKRSGISRRTAMGAAAGRVVTAPDGRVIRVLPVPLWACDPMPSRNDAGPGFDAAITPESSAWVDPMPDDLRWVDRALAALERTSLMRAMCLREELLGHGSQRMKAERVAERYGGSLTVWQYRTELGKALAFVAGWRGA